MSISGGLLIGCPGCCPRGLGVPPHHVRMQARAVDTNPPFRPLGEAGAIPIPEARDIGTAVGEGLVVLKGCSWEPHIEARPTNTDT